MICKHCRNDDHDACVNARCECCQASSNYDSFLEHTESCKICGEETEPFMHLCTGCKDSLSLINDYSEEWNNHGPKKRYKTNSF